MMGIETIRQMSREAAAKAAEENKQPYVVDREEIDDFPPFPFPDLGTHVPEGWEEVRRHFVDSSGFGADDEPALSLRQFLDVLREEAGNGYGYAIVEVGQFQLYVGVFARV